VTAVVRQIQRRNATTQTWEAAYFEYAHRDHLGSVDAITDGSGAILQKTSFDPYGGRRAQMWWADIPATGLDALLAWQDSRGSRGFTDHEQLNRTGFIHMNGRVYDPRIGRFVSPDPIVQAPWFSQSYNRYAYVFGSPMSYTDPSGLEPFEPLDVGGYRTVFYVSESGGYSEWQSYRPARDEIATSLYYDMFVSGLEIENYVYLQDEWAPGDGVSPPVADGESIVADELPVKMYPPLAPTGADIDANIREAEGSWNPFWFRNQVRNGGPWDYKQQGQAYEAFGNFNYGATGAAFGFPDSVLLNEAGRAQREAGTSRSGWGEPGPPAAPFLGTPPYGDDPIDQFWIRQGIDFYRNRDDWHTPLQVGH
jgi:RHS repeat-associated protein